MCSVASDEVETLKTKLAAAEQRLLLYETILDRLDIGIHVIDPESRTIVYNTMMAKLECEDRNNILGRYLLEAMPYLKPENSTLLTTLKTGQPLIDSQQTYINARGKQIVTINSTTPLWLGDKVVGVLEEAKDITFIRMLSEKIVDLQQNLIEQAQQNTSVRAPNTRYTFANILGQSPELLTAIDHARRAARTSSNVLIYGETGTGKELFAQSIHNLSNRKKQFIAVNCAALPEQLLEGLLFGTTKGGFTGAVDRPGFFEQANGGTLLLDELNSMPLDLQAKLLRALQEGSIRRIGATKEIAVDVRVIATVNNPVEAIQRHFLREDLYYRLGVVTICIPPLHERPEDIPVYVNHFIEQYNRQLGLTVIGLSPEVSAAFQRYRWPGNVRELAHAIEGAMNLMRDEREIAIPNLPMLFRANLFAGATEMAGPRSGRTGERRKISLTVAQEALEKERIINALAAADGNITHAAASLSISRQVLQYKIRKYGLANR